MARPCLTGLRPRRGRAGRFWPWTRAALVLVVGSTSSCGYVPVAASGTGQRVAVVPAPSKSPSVDALNALVEGAKQELHRTGSLNDGADYPRVVVELLRLDTSPIAITAEAGKAGASRVGVVGRGRLMQRAGVPPSRDTRDMRRVETYAAGASPVEDATRRDAAVRIAARRLGIALARRLLGAPEPRTELQ